MQLCMDQEADGALLCVGHSFRYGEDNFEWQPERESNVGYVVPKRALNDSSRERRV